MTLIHGKKYQDKVSFILASRGPKTALLSSLYVRVTKEEKLKNRAVAPRKIPLLNRSGTHGAAIQAPSQEEVKKPEESK